MRHVHKRGSLMNSSKNLHNCVRMGEKGFSDRGPQGHARNGAAGSQGRSGWEVMKEIGGSNSPLKRGDWLLWKKTTYTGVGSDICCRPKPCMHVWSIGRCQYDCKPAFLLGLQSIKKLDRSEFKTVFLFLITCTRQRQWKRGWREFCMIHANSLSFQMLYNIPQAR